MTMTLALGRVSIHQRMARAAAQSLPEELQPTTETRRLSLTSGVEELFLLGVGRPGVGEDVFDEAEGIVAVGREIDGGDGVLLS